MPEAFPVLWYFADPMCSWCWGFSPVIEAIREQYRDRLKIALMLGGLRPEVSAALSQTECDDILQHWHEVHARSGQTFNFDGAPSAGFVYDTEPASRAIISVGALDAAATFPYLKAVQHAFYVGQCDVTHTGVLADLAQEHGIARDAFLTHFTSEPMRKKTHQHFVHTRQAEVRGFPSLVAQNSAGHVMLSNGYCTLGEFQSVLDAWLASST